LISLALASASTTSQRKVLRQLARDLRHIGIRRLSVRVAFSTRDAKGDAINASPWLGYYEAGRIFLRPKLRGNALYTIALHEIGHHLGLEHERSASSIMAPAPTIAAGRLSLSWRKSCLSSFLRACTRERLAVL
jgi:hypothetical protein